MLSLLSASDVQRELSCLNDLFDNHFISIEQFEQRRSQITASSTASSILTDPFERILAQTNAIQLVSLSFGSTMPSTITEEEACSTPKLISYDDTAASPFSLDFNQIQKFENQTFGVESFIVINSNNSLNNNSNYVIVNDKDVNDSGSDDDCDDDDDDNDDDNDYKTRNAAFSFEENTSGNPLWFLECSEVPEFVQRKRQGIEAVNRMERKAKKHAESEARRKLKSREKIKVHGERDDVSRQQKKRISRQSALRVTPKHKTLYAALSRFEHQPGTNRRTTIVVRPRFQCTKVMSWKASTPEKRNRAMQFSYAHFWVDEKAYRPNRAHRLMV